MRQPELRQDTVEGRWVLISPGRAMRPMPHDEPFLTEEPAHFAKGMNRPPHQKKSPGDCHIPQRMDPAGGRASFPTGIQRWSRPPYPCPDRKWRRWARMRWWWNAQATGPARLAWALRIGTG